MDTPITLGMVARFVGIYFLFQVGFLVASIWQDRRKRKRPCRHYTGRCILWEDHEGTHILGEKR